MTAATSRMLGVSPLRWGTAVALLLVAAALAWRLPPAQLLPLLSELVWAHIIAACLFFPRRMGAWLLLLAVAVVAFLAGVNSLKAGLTGLPLTMLDLRIALTNPAGLWDSLNLPRWTLPLALMGLALVAALVLASGAAALRTRLQRQPWRLTAQHAAARLACLVAVVLIADANLQRMFQHLAGYRGTWEPDGLVAMAAEIGVLPFLAYSRHVESRNTGDFFRMDLTATPPDQREIEAAALRFVRFPPDPAHARALAPNIVVVLAESTFDPNRAFRLTTAVRSTLFTGDESTAAGGPLRVNVIGGGTWVTEFESITGLDSRLFGYAGYYTHSSLSPYVQRTLATDLAARGYRTLAVLPHEGEFYNYRNAYRAYGFDRVVDSRDLGLEAGWRVTDLRIAEALTDLLGAQPATPFLVYAALVENHGPHKCDVTSVAQMPVRFADTLDFEPNCALHEYLRRLRSTEAAVARIEDHLRNLEAREGRPWVLLVYGDHQPFTFTGTHMVRYDFRPFRTSAPLTETFFQVRASEPQRLSWREEDPPATLLPTLVSAFVAQRPRDLYLGVNLWLYGHCGPDAVHGRPLFELTRPSDSASEVAGGNDVRTADCADAYDRALAAYRRAGVMKLERSR